MAKSTGDPKDKPKQVSMSGAITKPAVKKHIESALAKKYPFAVFPSRKLDEYTNILLVSGLRQDAMDTIFKMEAERQGE